MKFKYDEKNRSGDHICYYSDLSKMKNQIRLHVEILIKEIDNNVSKK